MTRHKNEQDLIARTERLQEAIDTLNSTIEQIRNTGDIAPPKCYVLRYQARSKDKSYYYYKLHASLPIFTTSKGKKSKYKHLGKAGTVAHVEAVMDVARRSQIDSLQRAITSLTESWQDLTNMLEGEST